MNKSVCTEIAEFQVVSGLTDEDFIRIVEYLENSFHAKQGGFIDTELVKGKEYSQWLMIQHWESVEHAKEASKMMMKESIAEEFRNSLNPKTVKIRYFSHINSWSR